MKSQVCIQYIFLLLLGFGFGPAARADSDTSRPIIRIGIYQNEPKIYVNEDGEPDGFFVDLMTELSQRIGFTPTYVPVTWEQGLEALASGELDLMPDVILTPERKEKYLFNHITVLENWASLYIGEDQEPDYYTLQNLKDKTIAYLQDDNNMTVLKEQIGRDTSKLTFLPLPSYAQVLEAVEMKQADLGLVNFYYGKQKGREYNLQQLPLVINPATVHWASGSPEHKTLLGKIDKELCQLKDNKESAYYQLIDRWLDPDSKFKFPRWLSLLLSGLVILFSISLLTMGGLQYKLKNSRENLSQVNFRLYQKIEEKSQVEESLRKRNAELAATNRAMDQLVYRVSHNLRAPLTSVLGLIEIIKMEIPSSISNYMQAMEKSIHQLDGIIRDILDYYQNDRTEISLELVDLEKLIREVQESMSFMNREADIEFRLKVDASQAFWCDGRRVRSILNNLVSNALKYYNPYAQQPYIDIEMQVSKQEATIRVSDNGIGIPAEQQDKIFSMFFRGSNHSSGAGLGLYIVKETVDRLGGSIQLESELNQGTTFFLSLPNHCHEAVS